MGKPIDFTTYRKGTITRRNPVERIDYCPVCGRKGSLSQAAYEPLTGNWAPLTVIHKGIVELGTFFHITDQCVEYPALARLYNAGRLRSRHARRLAKRQIPDNDWPALPFERSR